MFLGFSTGSSALVCSFSFVLNSERSAMMFLLHDTRDERPLELCIVLRSEGEWWFDRNPLECCESKHDAD